jgi:hypothetical protein
MDKEIFEKLIDGIKDWIEHTRAEHRMRMLTTGGRGFQTPGA